MAQKWTDTLNPEQIFESLKGSGVNTAFVCINPHGMTQWEQNVANKFIESTKKQGISIVIIETPGAKPILDKCADLNIPVYIISAYDIDTFDNEVLVHVNLGMDSENTSNSDSLVLARLEQYAIDNATGVMCITENLNGWVRANHIFASVLGKRSILTYNKEGNLTVDKANYEG